MTDRFFLVTSIRPVVYLFITIRESKKLDSSYKADLESDFFRGGGGGVILDISRM